MKKFSLALIICLLTAYFISAQKTTPTPPPADESDVLKISTTLIQIDVTVTDNDGNVVTDLKPEDFEVYENGKKQDITNFSFISVNKPLENINPQTVRNNQTVKNNKDSIPIPSFRLRMEQVRRTYSLVVDDLGLSFASIFWVRESLKKFVNEQMQEGDLVAIIRTGSGMGAMQSFTSDKRQLLAAIDKIKYNFNGRSGISSFKPIESSLKQDLSGGFVNDPTGDADDKEFEKQVEDFRNEKFSVGTLGALNYVISGMRELPGRKAIMLYSEGFKLTTGNTSNRILDAMRVLADMANRSSVVIYTLDPRGLEVPGMANAGDDVKRIIDRDFDPANSDDERTERVKDFQDSQQSLRYLAYETGGIPFVNQNRLSKGLQQAIDDHGNYYLLGYQPNEDTFDPKKNKFNKLEVKVTRPKLKVRYRSGFFGITDKKIQNLKRAPEESLMAALTSPFGATGINLNLYPVYQNDGKNGDVIQALVYINAKDLKFTEASNGKRKANFDLVAMTFGDNGTLATNKYYKNYTVQADEKTYRSMMENGFVYTLPVPVKQSGAYQFRIALRDTNSDKVGSASQFIEVPNVKKQMALSNVILDNFTREEWRKVKLGGDPNSSEKNVLLDTTLRRFKRGTILRYDYVIYNPKKSRQIVTRLRLIKDGKIIYEKNPTPLKTENQSDLARLQAAGELTLARSLEAGNYILQIIAEEGEGGKRFATQFVEFEIAE